MLAKLSFFTGVFFIISGLFLSASPGVVSAQSVAPEAPVGNTLSRNWAGYVAQQPNTAYTAVGATWIVPSPSAGQGTQADATWVGVGGVSGHDLIQAGTQAIVQNGQVEYQAWVETLPQYTQTIPLAVKAGDSVTVSLAESAQGSGLWRLSFKNNTTGQSYSAQIAYNSSESSAEWIEEMPVQGGGQYIPLDNFGSVDFSGGYTVANGKGLTIGGSGARALSMGTSPSHLFAAPSALADSSSFSVSRSSISTAGSAPVYAVSTTHRHGRGDAYTVTAGWGGSYVISIGMPFSIVLRGGMTRMR